METEVGQSGRKGLQAKKRKEPSQQRENGTPSLTGRDLKRVKLREARAIEAQTSGNAFKNGEIGLESFINARKFEIEALERSLKQAKAVKSSRSFQLVPRGMRRRTASHNVKRIPKRLRDRAKREQEADNTPTVESRRRRPRTTRATLRAQTAKVLDILAKRKARRKLKNIVNSDAAVEGDRANPLKRRPDTICSGPPRTKIRRNALNDPQKPKAKFRKRQINKTWLPTHLWHAKRARMTTSKAPLWRFAIPLTPTDKCYRPTHRASGEKGTVVWDASYMSTIGLYGSEIGVERLLRSLGLTEETLWTHTGRKWRAGLRSLSCLLSKEQKEDRRIIGPATIVWNPVAVADSPDGAMTALPLKTQRQVFVRVHPSCFLELFTELQKLVKMQTPRPYVEDLRFELGSIELVGPGSTETLQGILQPFSSELDSKDQHGSFFKALSGITNPSSLPANAVLGFSVSDPRLAYPPRTAETRQAFDEIERHAMLESLATWPIDDWPRPFSLFDRDVRFKASQLPSMKSINRRKGSNPPGRALEPTVIDPPIPILLLASPPPVGGQSQGTWTLLAPWKCILPIWYSLVHYPLSTGGNPRFGGLDEARQVAFERNVPWFPADYPGTDAGAQWEIEQRIKRKGDWDRRHRSKRISWDALDLGAGRKGEIGSGFACDFEHLFGPDNNANIRPTEEEPAAGSKVAAETMCTALDSAGNPHGEPTRFSSASLEDPALTQIHQLSKDAFRRLALPGNEQQPPKNSILTVKISLVSRGVCSSAARIYRLPPASLVDVEVACTEGQAAVQAGVLPSNLREQWLRIMSREQPLPQSQPRHMPKTAGNETRKALLVKSFTSHPPLPARKEVKFAHQESDQDDDVLQPTLSTDHPLCPGPEDLIGFVTTGSFSLSQGKGTAIGSISALEAAQSLRTSAKAEATLCIVRNAGERVGRLARWRPM